MDLSSALYWYFAVLVFLLGLCVGSFLGVCIDRIPAGLSIRKPPSHCPGCQTRLTTRDLVPVVSYLLLWGKCRYCGQRIPIRYMLVELLTGFLFLICYWRIPFSLQLLPALVLTAILITAAFIDAEHTIIPNGLVLFGAIAGVLFLAAGTPSWKDALLGVVAGGGPLLAIDGLARLLMKKEGMGGGDTKLMAMAGLFLGWKMALVALVVSVLMGGLAGACLLLSRRMKAGQYFAFGPFLAAGSFLALTFGGDMLRLYAAFNGMILHMLLT